MRIVSCTCSALEDRLFFFNDAAESEARHKLDWKTVGSSNSFASKDQEVGIGTVQENNASNSARGEYPLDLADAVENAVSLQCLLGFLHPYIQA